MKLKPKYLQDGGSMPQGAPQEGAPQEAAGGGQEQDPMAQLLQVAAQALQSKDCNAAMAVCDGLIQILQQAQGGQQQAPQGEPVYKKGGVLAYRKKA